MRKPVDTGESIGNYLTNRKTVSFETRSAREQYRAIGWGVQNDRLNANAVNV